MEPSDMNALAVSPHTSRRTVLKTALSVLVLPTVAGFLSACTQVKPKFQSVDLTGAEYATGFSLTDHNGTTRTLKDFRGKVVVVFFGFTQCPDVCPTTMVELAKVKELLGADGDKLQAVFVSVDPERDTPEILKAYMGNFDPSFVALRPTPVQLAEMAKDFKVFYKRVDGKTLGSYSMDHTAGSYVFDGNGKIRLFTRYGGGAEMLAADVRQLIKST
jgi:protein SCO1/2